MYVPYKRVIGDCTLKIISWTNTYVYYTLIYIYVCAHLSPSPPWPSRARGLAAAFSTGPIAAFSIGPTSSALPVSSTLVNSMCRRASFPKQQEDIVLKARVANVCFKCSRCFECMLQVFYTGVAKIDRDVAHVAMAIHICSNYFICFRHICKCFGWML
jgi:hypothetical protein